VRVTFHGVRGSVPVSGPEFDGAGGHTSCVAVSEDGGLPTLVLDAGTGLLRLARDFARQPFRGTILLTHLHWDHLHGLPFFPPADRDDAEVVLAQPAQGDPVALLERAMSPPHFPIGPLELAGRWEHRAIEPGRHRFGAFDVLAREVEHKGGRTFGYRIEAGGAACCYVPDARDDETIAEFAAGADLLVRGAPFLSTESAWAVAYGHGTAEHAVEVARRAGVRRLLLTHHGPSRTDAQLAAIAGELGVEFVVEGLTLELGPGDADAGNAGGAGSARQP
jgi:phosphoribosyl 1,2-cyclic phosphodiesterase